MKNCFLFSFFLTFPFFFVPVSWAISDYPLIVEVQIAGETQVEKIDVNTASLEELQKITGVGPVIAQRIIEARPFYSLDELTKVSGIGPKTLENIKKQGLAWVDPKLEPPKIEKTESFASTQNRPLDKGLAAVAESFKKTFKSFSVFLIALAIAISSGIIILILKRKMKNLDLSKK